MDDEVKFCANTSSDMEIADHLSQCDASFVPPLSSRVEIAVYATKLANNAVRFEAWASDKLIGLIAIYCNDEQRSKAYITSVSVMREWQNKGLAQLLLEKCLLHAKSLGFASVELEVHSQNDSALNLYVKNGFQIESRNDHSVTMRLDLNRSS